MSFRVIVLLGSLLCSPLIAAGFTASPPDAAPPVPLQATELTHWLTTSSGIRHNSGCRWFQKSKGRMCRADEGRACKVCGG